VATRPAIIKKSPRASWSAISSLFLKSGNGGGEKKKRKRGKRDSEGEAAPELNRGGRRCPNSLHRTCPPVGRVSHQGKGKGGGGRGEKRGKEKQKIFFQTFS